MIASAAGSIENGAVAQVEHYKYSQSLDIKKVISMTKDGQADSICGPVEAHMVYIDSKGVQHDLEYAVMGDGCQAG
ncbi:DUF2790 domain-containing protein [Pseudomonas mohnii]